MGQCCKIIHSKPPFTLFSLSTKKIFDDMYLYLEQVNRQYLGTKGIDPMNGLPVNGYQEVSSQYWNMIYKKPAKTKVDMTTAPA